MSTSTDDLFPVPSSPPSTLIPIHWPGISPESTAALREVLKDNHERWHAFFNDHGFHKYVAATIFPCPESSLDTCDLDSHSAHHALAVWALGANGAVIKGGYRNDSSFQRPAFKSPEVITTANFNDYIGDKRSVI
jgi:hypothetical protein